MTTLDDNHFGAGQKLLDALPLGHFIDGDFVVPASTSTLRPVANPADGRELCVVAEGGDADVRSAVAAAGRALPAWRSRTPGERAAVLLRIADVIEANADRLAAVESLNTGKPMQVVAAELPAAADLFRFMAGAARTSQAPAADEYTPGHLSMIRREPVGVVAAISPWNYPLMIAAWKLAPGLAAGNTVVLKPSELTPLSTLLLAQLTADLVPAGVLNVVLGEGATVGAALTRDPQVGMVSFTGSVRAGTQVATSASRSLKRLHLELGGKAPVVVFPDADLAAVVEGVRTAGFWNSGQDCGAATRVLCAASVAGELADRLVAAAESLDVGDPREGESVEMGPLISAGQHARVSGMVERALSDGADRATGGNRIDRPGFFYQPTVLRDVAPGSEMSTQEVFGPVVSIETFTSERDALARANGVDYGLSASVWTTDVSRALRVTAQLDFGTVWTNSHLTTATEMPWGGFGQSGYGRDMSTYALDDHSRTKHVMIAVKASTETASAQVTDHEGSRE